NRTAAKIQNHSAPENVGTEHLAVETHGMSDLKEHKKTQLRQAANPQPHDRLLQNLTHRIALDRSGHIGLSTSAGYDNAIGGGPAWTRRTRRRLAGWCCSAATWLTQPAAKNRAFRRTKNLSRRTRSRRRWVSLPSKLATFASAAAHAAAIFFLRKPRFPVRRGLSFIPPS